MSSQPPQTKIDADVTIDARRSRIKDSHSCARLDARPTRPSVHRRELATSASTWKVRPHMDASSRQASDGGGSCLRIVRMFAATCMLAFGLVAADALMTDVGAAPPPASCGAVNEPPCFPLFCDAGLVLSHGLCVRRDSLGFPTNCGDWNELPCEIWVHIPSCKPGLIEHTGRCRMPDETFPPGCGGLNQRPCTIFEHIPSCKSNLVESHGLCVARDSDGFPTNCGGHDEIACVSIPACKPGLVIDLLAGGRCLPCGEDGRIPCIGQACKTGFRFNFNPLAPACIAMGPNVEPDCACSVIPQTSPAGSRSSQASPTCTRIPSRTWHSAVCSSGAKCSTRAASDPLFPGVTSRRTSRP